MKTKLRLLSILCMIGLNFQSYAQTGMDFDGINDYVSVPDASSLIAGSGQISLSLWVYPENEDTGWPDFDGFAGFRNNTNADFYIMQLGGVDIEARFRNESGTVYDIVYSGLVLNAWNHFVLTYDGSVLTLYHDGTNAGSIAASGVISSTTTALDLGRTFFTFDDDSFYLDGKLDHIGLWNTAFSEEEVTELYENHCDYNLSLPELVLSYEFTEGIIDGDNTGLAGLEDGKGNIDGSFSGLALDGDNSNYVEGITGGRSSFIDVSFCDSYTVPSGDETYTDAGVYKDTLISVSGCDSIITINLTKANTFASISETFCGSYTVPSGDDTYTEEGIYVDVIPNIAGCDSIITITLTSEATFSIIEETACLTYTVPSGSETFDESGIYIDTLVNVAGCDSLITIYFTVLEVNTEVTVEEDTLTAVETEGTYQWINCADFTEIDGATEQSFTPEDNGEYALVMNTGECIDTSACHTITIWVADLPTEELDNIAIFPNPLQDNLIINLNSTISFVNVSISTIAGELVLEQSFANTNKLVISLENEPAGIYFVHLNTGETSKTVKVVKN